MGHNYKVADLLIGIITYYNPFIHGIALVGGLTRVTNHLLNGMILQVAQRPLLNAGILSSGSSHAMPPVLLACSEGDCVETDGNASNSLSELPSHLTCFDHGKKWTMMSPYKLKPVLFCSSELLDDHSFVLCESIFAALGVPGRIVSLLWRRGGLRCHREHHRQT